MAQLRTLPLVDQVKTLMKNGRSFTEVSLPPLLPFKASSSPLLVKVIQFANLMGLLASGTDSTAVLRCIQQVALLVQGNWVVKR